MDVVMAPTAQPQQVVGDVAATLGAERDVVRVGACSALTDVAGLADHGEAKAEDGLRVNHTLRWARVSR